MVLHLLGKKSWNVYNAANIARVRRDEAEVAAKEEAEEQRMQDEDAKHRLAILRGDIPLPIEAPPTETPDDELRGDAEAAARPHKERKTRKLAGEDVTDFELRVAKDQISKDVALWAPKASSSAPLVGRDGHLDLIGDDGARRRAEKNEDAEREVAKRKREYEDQFTMRLANAAGKFGTTNPWYTAKATGEQPTEFDAPAKDVWGNDDPRRPEREAKRLTSNDPLAMMKSGAARVREVNKARAAVQLEREEELRRLRKEDRRRERHERREGRRGERREERRGGREGERRGERSRSREGERRSSDRSERRDSDRRRRRSLSPERDRSRRGEDRRRRH